MDQKDNSSYGYGKRPLWQWVLIYAVIGIVVYGLIYYFVFAKKRGYNSFPTTPPVAVTPTQIPEATSSPAEALQNTVTLTANGFSPATLTVKAGTKVTWSNKNSSAAINSNPHPTHSDYQPLNLGSFPQGGTLSLTFGQPGTYGYHNHLNPGQTGTIIVQ